MGNKLVYLLSLCTMVLAGCSEKGRIVPEPQPVQGGVYITLGVKSVSETGTGGTADIEYPVDEGGVMGGNQHVKTVYLYIFSESGEYLACEDIGWEDYFSSGLPDGTASMKYKVKYEGFQYGEEYTFMALGLSDGAETLYGFPDAGETGDPENITVSLAGGQSWKGISISEVFVGTESFVPGSGSDVTVELFRRMAGVVGYFKNAPKEAVSIRISLYQRQNTQMPLLERQQTPEFLDFINSPVSESEGKLLVDIALDGTLSPEQMISGGAYVMPVAAPVPGQITSEAEYTLKLELVAGDGTILQTRRIRLPEDDGLNSGSTGSGTGIIDTESAYRYPVVANHFYAIGSPDSPVDLQGEGGDLVITIDPTWEGEVDLGISEKQ